MKNIFVLVTLLFANILVLANCSNNSQTPSQNIHFQKFRLNVSAGPCQPGADCTGFIEIDSTGTLTYDKLGELPEGSVHATTVTQSELNAARSVLTNSSLIALLDLSGQICQPPTDAYETMTLWTLEASHSHETTSCNNQPIEDARQLLNNLASNYF